MKIYLEFNKQEYYGLIAVGYSWGDTSKKVLDKALEIYVETIAGDNVGEVLTEGLPEQVTKEYAFWKLANCHDSKNYPVEELLKQFEEMENTCVVIDGALV